MIRFGSDFSGVGAANQALKRLGIEYKEVFACEIDKFARQTFVLNHGEPEYFPYDVYDRVIPGEPLDLYISSPPCQTFSTIGLREGENDDRGVLFYNSHEFIGRNKPRFFVFENVKGLLSIDQGAVFARWVDYLGGKSINGAPVMFPHKESVPYHIYWRVLNAKDYDIPQNRERVFIVGIRDDQDNNFSFPDPVRPTRKLSDIVEREADERYYLSDKMLNWLNGHSDKHAKRGNGFKFKPLSIDSEVSPTITARVGQGIVTDPYLKDKQSQRVRKLTPRECLRLQDFEDSFDISGVSVTQAYKQAGNSVVVKMYELIFEKLLC